MARKVALLPVILVTLAALLLVSCGPKASAPVPSTPTPATPTPATPTPTTPTPAAPTPVASTEKPKYGGTINIISPRDVTPFPLQLSPGVHSGFVYQQLLMSDWSRGPAGSGESSFGDSVAFMNWKDVIGQLAESFETPEIGVWIVNIRKGAHFGLNPDSEASRLVNGREFTVDDAIASINFVNTTPGSRHQTSIPYLVKSVKLEKTGPSQLTLTAREDPMTAFSWYMSGPGGGVLYMWPKEVIEKYGKTLDWNNVVGTGAYMITDYVSGSAVTFKRNPNFWVKNTVGSGKGDQLPYPDFFKWLIVPDLSTRVAALRTARADMADPQQSPFLLEDARGLLATNSSLKSHKFLEQPMVIHMRTDKAELPYKDIKVRQALHMAIDNEAIRKDLYRGEAEVLTTPVMPIKGSEGVYTPLEQLPEAARALYKYNPERAKQLLSEAGYPNGFKAKIIVRNTTAETDMISIVQAMWDKVGVKLEIQPRERAVYDSIKAGRTHEDMVFSTLTPLTDFNHRFKYKSYRGVEEPGYFNDPPGLDPVIEAAYQKIQPLVILNFPAADEITKGLVPYIVEKAYYIPVPTPYSYRIWQPWIKNYYGDLNPKHWVPYVWIDQDLKEKMTGRR